MALRRVLVAALLLVGVLVTPSGATGEVSGFTCWFISMLPTQPKSEQWVGAWTVGPLVLHDRAPSGTITAASTSCLLQTSGVPETEVIARTSCPAYLAVGQSAYMACVAPLSYSYPRSKRLHWCSHVQWTTSDGRESSWWEDFDPTVPGSQCGTHPES